MKKKALIVWGGWDGHEPDKVAHRFGKILEGENFDVEISDSMTSYEDREPASRWLRYPTRLPPA